MLCFSDGVSEWDLHASIRGSLQTSRLSKLHYVKYSPTVPMKVYTKILLIMICSLRENHLIPPSWCSGAFFFLRVKTKL